MIIAGYARLSLVMRNLGKWGARRQPACILLAHSRVGLARSGAARPTAGLMPLLAASWRAPFSVEDGAIEIAHALEIARLGTAMQPDQTRRGGIGGLEIGAGDVGPLQVHPGELRPI